MKARISGQRLATDQARKALHASSTCAAITRNPSRAVKTPYNVDCGRSCPVCTDTSFAARQRSLHRIFVHRYQTVIERHIDVLPVHS